MKLKDKVAVVTGAASGIGAEVARLFAQEGAKVALVDRDAVATPPAGARLFQGDVADAAFAAKTVADVVRAWGRIDVVLTAAGMSVGKNITDTTEEEWDRVFAVNAKGTFLWVKAALAPMIAGGGGSVITVASQIPLSGGRNTASYAASKGAVIALTKSVALDYAADKVRANALAPGAIDTPFLQRSFARAADPAAARQRSIDRHPMGRFGTVEEVARAALFLASDDSSFTTGSVLMVEGGWNAG
jgi:NAD(P)-dependent dehydrogenase (short-subunit alcohol dehydrogenase family)